MADEPTGRAWARAKFDWLDRVADNLAGRHLVFCVAHALLRDTDKATGITGITQREIAGKIVVHKRSVQLAIDSLEEAGFLTVIKPKGRRLGNRYRLHLPPEPPKDPSLAVSAALKSDPSLAVSSALKEASLAHPDSLFSGSQTAPYPRSSPVEDHPRQGATAPPTPKTTTIGVADDGLLDQIRQAIEAAGGKLAKRRHQLQPIRDLIAGGVPRDLVVATIADRAAVLARKSGPLGNLDAAWLLEFIRDRATADGYGAGQPAEASTAKPAETGPTVAIPGHETTRWPADTVAARAARWWSDRTRWAECLGEPPDRPDPRRSPECQAAVDAGREMVAAAIAAWRHDPKSWDRDRLGPPPDSLASRLGPDFGIERVTLRSGETMTVFALDRHLRVLAEDFGDDEFARCYRALPSPFDAEDCTLSLEWQVKALEYRAAKS